MRPQLFIAAAAFALSAGACLRFEPTNAFPCSSNTDCAQGHSCIEGICRDHADHRQDRCADALACSPVSNGGCGVSPRCVDSDGLTCVYTHLADGTACTRDTDPAGVASGHCEGGVCAACLISAHCALGETCVAGACLSNPTLEPCVENAACASNHCECIDSLCQSRVCAAASCTCRYGVGGACDTALDNGVRDPGDCDGPTELCSEGLCQAPATGECVTHSDCLDGYCECTNATCTLRRCAPQSCTCHYGASGACTVRLNSGVDDPGDCEGASSCYAGVCKLDGGQNCTGNASCGTGQCECADATCSTRVCATASCTCGYGPGGGCSQPLSDGTRDPGDCTGTNACYAGECLLALKSSCTADSQCGSGHCECADGLCSNRVCAAADCVCSYGVNGACESNLTGETEDPEDCSAPSSCVDGKCGASTGQSCQYDWQCASDHCECVDATCSTHACGWVSCPPCTFNEGADATCDGNVVADHFDPSLGRWCTCRVTSGGAFDC